MKLDELKKQLHDISVSIHGYADDSIYVGNGYDFYINFNQDPHVIKISKTLDADLMNAKVQEIQQLLKSYGFTSDVIVTDLTPFLKEYKISFTTI